MKFFARPMQDDIEAAGQARVDAIVAAARAQTPTVPVRPKFREPAHSTQASSTDLIDNRLAEELAFARRTLENMGDSLCDDAVFLARHQVTLQTVDLLAQILGHLATVIGSADREKAVSQIGMVELRNRLGRKTCGAVEAGTGFHRSEFNPFHRA
jgi:hypothetical protein